MPVYVLTRAQPVPETRVDHGAFNTEIIGVAATKQRAQIMQADVIQERRDEAARAEGFQNWATWIETNDYKEDGWDPEGDSEYTIRGYAVVD